MVFDADGRAGNVEMQQVVVFGFHHQPAVYGLLGFGRYPLFQQVVGVFGNHAFQAFICQFLPGIAEAVFHRFVHLVEMQVFAVDHPDGLRVHFEEGDIALLRFPQGTADALPFEGVENRLRKDGRIHVVLHQVVADAEREGTDAEIEVRKTGEGYYRNIACQIDDLADQVFAPLIGQGKVEQDDMEAVVGDKLFLCLAETGGMGDGGAGQGFCQVFTNQLEISRIIFNDKDLQGLVEIHRIRK